MGNRHSNNNNSNNNSSEPAPFSNESQINDSRFNRNKMGKRQTAI